jgi:hypothetical protein
MITTDDRYEFTILPFMQAPGTKVWRLVGLELRLPYFFVSYACKEGKAWISQTSLLWHENDVLNFCQEVGDDISKKIHQIALLVPPDPDNIRAWRMFTLKEIWTGRIRGEDRQSAMVCVGMDGERVVKSMVTDDESRIESIEIAYRSTVAVDKNRARSPTSRKRTTQSK